MSLSELNTKSDSLIEILSAQCSDLERLLTLARQETSAIEECDFGEVMRVADARSVIGERLEVYHRQISELRERMDEGAESILESDVARGARRLIVEIQAEDRKLLPLLMAKREDASKELSRLDHTRRSTNAYLRDSSRTASVACDARV